MRPTIDRPDDERDCTATAKTDIGGLPDDPPKSTMTLLIGGNALVHMGLMRLLSGTQFAVSDFACIDAQDLSDRPESFLFLVLNAGECPGVTAETVKGLKVRWPQARVCVLATHFDIALLMPVHDAGADGFCLTTANRNVLIKILELAAMGESILPSALAHTLLVQMSDCPARPHEQVPCTEKPQSHPPRLSGREVDILGILAEGASNKEIARKFGLSDATIKVHVKAILRKIGVTNRTQAALWAVGYLVDKPGDRRQI